MDIRIKEPIASKEALERLNQTMVEGMEVVRFCALPENSKNAMSIVAAADYEIRFQAGREPADGWEESLLKFLQSPEIRLVKKTKRGQQEVDIRPWVYDCRIEQGIIVLQAAAGSVHNLKPELLLQAFADWAGFEIEPFSLLVHRKELYANEGSEEQRVLIPLEALGEDIGE